MNFTFKLGAFLLSLLSFTTAANTELVVYTNIEPENLNKYAQAFEAKNPDIKIKWVRDSAGPITARLLAEKNAPKADVVFGLALNSVLSLQSHDLFESYTPLDSDKVSPMMKDAGENPIWVGINAWASGFCVNTREMEKRKLAIPATWKDLTKPEYKDLLVMPNPASSSTGYMDVAAWLHLWGNEGGWQYMKDLHANMKMYTHSGCKPCQMAAQGEIPIGISSGVCAKPFIAKKAPLSVVIPSDGVGWDMESAAILKSSANKEAARKLMDFAASKEAALIAADNDYIPGRIEFSTEDGKATQEQFIDIDFAKSAADRDSVLKQWREQFENK
jgi:iron(III) transport system substrate-binding protein